jgi:hypothetical protein
MRVTTIVVRMTLYLPRRLFSGQSGSARWLVAEGRGVSIAILALAPTLRGHNEPGIACQCSLLL